MVSDYPQTFLIPGEGIGNSLRLGQSMFTVVNMLKKFNYKMVVSYSDKDYLNTPVIINLPLMGIRLLFENTGAQTLILIEILNFEFLFVSYKGFSLNDFEFYREERETLVLSIGNSEDEHEEVQSHYMTKKKVSLATLKDIYNRIFGPTYPGKLSSNSKSYLLSYPGVSFKFAITLSELTHKVYKVIGNENLVLSKLLNWDTPEDVSVDSICVFKGNSYHDFFSSLLKHSVNAKTLASSGAIKLRVYLKQGKIEVHFGSAKKFILELGKTTQQEVLNILGPPDDYFNKFDSRLLIHNHLSKTINFKNDSRDISVWKFHNYYNYGLDLLYDINDLTTQTATGILKKIIIHNGGIAESLDFMKWNKCNWEICDDGTENVGIDSSMYFRDIYQYFKAANHSSEDIRPVILNRSESEFVDNDLDVINLRITNKDSNTTKDLSYASSIDSNSKTKTWGQSKLYGWDRCIWEVIDANGCVSSVTIY